MTVIPEGYEAEAVYLKLTNALKRMHRQASYVVHPDEEERENLDYLVNQVMDSAHELLDLAHDLKHAVRLTNAR